MLVVGSSRTVRALFEMQLDERGYGVDLAETLHAARGLMADAGPDVVVVDPVLPDGDGLDLVDQAPVVVLADEDTIGPGLASPGLVEFAGGSHEVTRALELVEQLAPPPAVTPEVSLTCLVGGETGRALADALANVGYAITITRPGEPAGHDPRVALGLGLLPDTRRTLVEHGARDGLPAAALTWAEDAITISAPLWPPRTVAPAQLRDALDEALDAGRVLLSRAVVRLEGDDGETSECIRDALWQLELRVEDEGNYGAEAANLVIHVTGGDRPPPCPAFELPAVYVRAGGEVEDRVVLAPPDADDPERLEAALRRALLRDWIEPRPSPADEQPAPESAAPGALADEDDLEVTETTRTPDDHRVVVLLVDDQAIVGAAVRRMLSGEPNVDVHHCLDPTEAIAMAERVHPTVILQDLVMPKIDGLTMVRRFRARPSTRDIPIIVLSGEEDPKIKARAFATRANDYIVKLPDLIEFVARVKHHSWGYINHLLRLETFAALETSNTRLRNMSLALRRRNQFIQKTFGRYLSEEIVESLLDRPDGLDLGGEKRRLTILMSDLRGFTAFSEGLPPESVVKLLNRYLEKMVEVILTYGGTVDEFIGDAILAIFGAPISYEDDAARAVACAVAMQQTMPEVNAELRALGLPGVEMGIAINTGEVVVGNIGSEKRAKYGIVGSHVNLTARIESNTIGGQVLISEQTLREAGREQVDVGQVYRVNAKGFREPITAFELLGIRGPFDLAMPESDDERVTLPAPAPIEFCVLAGKQVSQDFQAGELLAASARSAEVRLSVAVPALSNLLLRLFDPDGGMIDADVYGKVTAVAAAPEGVLATLRFTSVPVPARSYLDRVAPPG